MLKTARSIRVRPPMGGQIRCEKIRVTVSGWFTSVEITGGGAIMWMEFRSWRSSGPENVIELSAGVNGLRGWVDRSPQCRFN